MLTRALIVLLLVLNLGVAVWWITRAPAAARAPPTPTSGVARLQLVGERSPDKPPVAEASDAGDVISQCLGLGPFASAQLAADARKRLQPLALEIRSRREHTGTAQGWEVFLPPLETVEQAEAAAQRVAAAGFSDYYVMRDGARSGALALGVYSSEGTARERVATLAAAGIDAVAAPRGDGTTEHWLDVAAGADFDAVSAQALVDAARREPLACSQFTSTRR